MSKDKIQLGETNLFVYLCECNTIVSLHCKGTYNSIAFIHRYISWHSAVLGQDPEVSCFTQADTPTEVIALIDWLYGV